MWIVIDVFKGGYLIGVVYWCNIIVVEIVVCGYNKFGI